VTPTAATNWRELARRTGNGVEVALLWNQARGCVKVAVSDARLCHHVDLELTGADALRAFEEPFAHASSVLWDVRNGPRAPTSSLDSQEDWGMN
jgi:hypothetical protein